MMDETSIKSSIKAWLAEHNCSVKADDIKDDTRIIDERIITSMQVMDLILYVESLRNGPVDPGQIKPGSFQTVNAIYETFFPV